MIFSTCWELNPGRWISIPHQVPLDHGPKKNTRNVKYILTTLGSRNPALAKKKHAKKCYMFYCSLFSCAFPDIIPNRLLCHALEAFNKQSRKAEAIKESMLAIFELIMPKAQSHIQKSLEDMLMVSDVFVLNIKFWLFPKQQFQLQNFPIFMNWFVNDSK